MATKNKTKTAAAPETSAVVASVAETTLVVTAPKKKTVRKPAAKKTVVAALTTKAPAAAIKVSAKKRPTAKKRSTARASVTAPKSAAPRTHTTPVTRKAVFELDVPVTSVTTGWRNHRVLVTVGELYLATILVALIVIGIVSWVTALSVTYGWTNPLIASTQFVADGVHTLLALG